MLDCVSILRGVLEDEVREPLVEFYMEKSLFFQAVKASLFNKERFIYCKFFINIGYLLIEINDFKLEKTAHETEPKNKLAFKS